MTMADKYCVFERETGFPKKRGGEESKVVKTEQAKLLKNVIVVLKMDFVGSCI